MILLLGAHGTPPASQPQRVHQAIQTILLKQQRHPILGILMDLEGVRHLPLEPVSHTTRQDNPQMRIGEQVHAAPVPTSVRNLELGPNLDCPVFQPRQVKPATVNLQVINRFFHFFDLRFRGFAWGTLVLTTASWASSRTRCAYSASRRSSIA